MLLNFYNDIFNSNFLFYAHVKQSDLSLQNGKVFDLKYGRKMSCWLDDLFQPLEEIFSHWFLADSYANRN